MLGLALDPKLEASLDLPDEASLLRLLRRPAKETPHDILRKARDVKVPAVQPRCGVGGHEQMKALLRRLENDAAPNVLSVTIDSHTRLGRFGVAAETLRRTPENLNGYPLVAHGWQLGRELDASVKAPLEIRHGSPDPRTLFAVALASGVTSFEGGGVTYNLPYSKNVPLSVSLEAWRRVDAACGILASEGVVVDRELFGTLTAVLMPPSLSLAVTLLEALAAVQEGVRCISIAYPQGGAPTQDVAALRAIPVLAERYLPSGVDVFPVLHQFMGVFPRCRERADALILLGGMVARIGGAAKVITKTFQEAYGIPDAEANAAGMNTTRLAFSPLLAPFDIDEGEVADEQAWVEREVAELVEPVLTSRNLNTSIEAAFREGRLDIPFSPSIHAHSQVIPARDTGGAIRYMSPGRLPLSRATLRRQYRLLEVRRRSSESIVEGLTRDIEYFSRGDRSPLEKLAETASSEPTKAHQSDGVVLRRCLDA